MSSAQPSPRDEPTRSSCAERRAFVRYASDLTAACRAPQREAGWMAQVQDISAGGIGLFLRHRFRPGTPLVLELRRPDGSPARAVSARVVHAVPFQVEGTQGWRIGCMFTVPLSADELRALAPAAEIEPDLD